MSGDPTKVDFWSGADVYIAPLGSTVPTDLETDWAAAWKPAGLLDGDEGFTWEREVDTADFFAWGGIHVKTTKSKHKRTVTVVMLEDNDVTFDVINPGSTRTTALGVTTSVVKVPESKEFMIGFEMNEGDLRKRRWVKRAAVQSVAEIKESESNPTVYTPTIVLYPEADKTLFTELAGVIA
ncbi:hypothetical protein AB0H43_03015 [Hamadaea sp. NPDC050747]|uniref:phage tail tube protein n=1 Tax=Hamadaea sp. NPDC050747 TaxID=3155789 RepID=UPI0033E0DE3D